MKIKMDFVTNSSSTCYVVAIPQNLEIQTENETANNFIKIILDQLKTEGVVEFGWCAEYPFERPEGDDQDIIMENFYDGIHNKILNKDFLIFEEEK